jgi:hypothetical protein
VAVSTRTAAAAAIFVRWERRMVVRSFRRERISG